MITYKNFILNSEDILMDKVLKYAKEHNYTKYTSTLKEAWRLSIAGLSDALIIAMEKNDKIPELGPDDDYSKDEIAEFGIMEARKHRSRGITLGMFLGLMKYYQQAYIDLIKESELLPDEKEYFSQYVKRYFDHLELGFTIEWSGLSKKQEFEELQEINRSMTNEKNKYLTVFESIYDPIILINKQNNIENINHGAVNLLFDDASGMKYYSNIHMNFMPDWLKNVLQLFTEQCKEEILLERTLETKLGQKTFMIKLKKMLDISEKYSGTVIIFYDITERLKIERELKIQYEKMEVYAHTDPMTGISNRRTGIMLLEQELSLLSNETPLCICFIDIDGLKTVNDTYGHAEGDALINFIVSGIKSTISKADMVSRMGGDEFLIVFPNRREMEADKIMKQICSQMAEFDQKGEKPYQHSFSYGIIEVTRENALSTDDIIKEVDMKMYQNKNLKKSLQYKKI